MRKAALLGGAIGVIVGTIYATMLWQMIVAVCAAVSV